MQMTDNWPNVLAHVDLEKTYERFPDDVREALVSARKFTDQMQSGLGYSDEPSHVFHAKLAIEQ